MKINNRSTFRAALVLALMLVITLASSRLRADSGICGGVTTMVPFTDVGGNAFFCSIAEAFFSGLTNGTTPTTYSPSQSVLRDQMAAFVTRTLDQSLKRGSRRAALKQFWTPTTFDDLTLTTVGVLPVSVESDGADLWVANSASDEVSRVRASDGKLLETYSGATGAMGVLCAKGLIFVTGCQMDPGKLYQIDPTIPAGSVTTVTSNLGPSPEGIAFDGARVWTANIGGVSIVTLNPVNVMTVTTGFNLPTGMLFDGANIWVTDRGPIPGNLLKLDSNGNIIQTVPVGESPGFPVFDGTNIWVPNFSSNSITVVRASTGAIIATLSGNGLGGPLSAAFDGERILITSFNVDSVSVWNATSLTPLGSVNTGLNTRPYGTCSDGLNFWIALQSGSLARF
jgi:hypothetical protein